MDLQEFKKSWKLANERPIGVEHKSIASLKDKSSSSPLVKLRKSMFIELILLVLVIIIMLGAFQLNMFNHSSFSENLLFVFLGLMIILYSIFAFNIYKKSKQTFFSDSITHQLEKNIASLKKDIRYYKIYNFAMCLPAIILGLIIANKAIDSIHSLGELRPFEKLLTIVLIIVLMYPSYMLINWWTDKFYGQYVEELEEAYKEISANE